MNGMPGNCFVRIDSTNWVQSIEEVNADSASQILSQFGMLG
jgi:hypothetical protein